MGFQQGLSGLTAAAKSLEVTGNNIANASTVGFKQAQAQFSDMYANSMNRSGSSAAGIGVNVAAVTQQFTQGNITTTNNPLDVAINGDGFFRMVSNVNNNTPLYGRNGQFQLDKNGYIVNPSENNAMLTGLPAGVVGGDPVPIQINTASIPATQTAIASDKLNLDSRDAVIASATTPFDPANTATYHNTTGMTVYDSLGNTHNIQTYYVKSAVTSGAAPTTTWDVYATVDGVPTPAATPGSPIVYNKVGSLTFDANGVTTAATAAAQTFSFGIPAGSGTAAFSVPINYTGTIQSGSAFTELARAQDGKAPGILTGFNVAIDGSIVGSYTNGTSKNLGTVTLSTFANPNGLQPLGNNLYAAGPTAGQAISGKPGTGGLGALQARATESSNVDLTAELVNMIVAQRVYQANAQTVKAEDTILQTAVNGL